MTTQTMIQFSKGTTEISIEEVRCTKPQTKCNINKEGE